MNETPALFERGTDSWPSAGYWRAVLSGSRAKRLHFPAHSQVLGSLFARPMRALAARAPSAALRSVVKRRIPLVFPPRL
jgi:hypothetical protein